MRRSDHRGAIAEMTFVGMGPRFCCACAQGVLFESEVRVFVCVECRTCRWFCARCVRLGHRIEPFRRRTVGPCELVLEHPVDLCRDAR